MRLFEAQTLTKTAALRLGMGKGGSGRLTPGVPELPVDDVIVVSNSAARPEKKSILNNSTFKSRQLQS